MASARHLQQPSKHCNFVKSLCDFRKLRPRRKRRLCAPAHDIVPDLWDFPICSEGQWQHFEMKLAGTRTFRLRSTRCPLHTRRGLISHRSARGSGRVPCIKKPVQVAHCRGDASHCCRRRKLENANSRYDETNHSSRAAAKAQRAKKVQVEIGSRSPCSPPKSSLRLCSSVPVASKWVVHVFFTRGLLQKWSSPNLSAMTSQQFIPVTILGGVGSRCPPAHAVARRSCCLGSAMEVWAFSDENFSLHACTRRSTTPNFI